MMKKRRRVRKKTEKSKKKSRQEGDQKKKKDLLSMQINRIVNRAQIPNCVLKALMILMKFNQKSIFQ